MSHKVVTLVYSRVVGSAHRKAILAYMADKASDDGRGVFCSKGTISDETEIARSTVFKTIRDLVAEGMLIEVGHRACRNGATVVYDLNLEVIRAFPEVKSNQSASRTCPTDGPVQSVTSPGAGPYQSDRRTPTSPGAGPKPSLEPSLNQEKEEEGARAVVADLSLIGRLTHALGFDHQGIVPKYWVSPDAAIIVARWQTDLGLTPNEILHVATGNAKAHGSPANGPKTLTRHMQDFAAAKNAPHLEPTKGAPHERPTSCGRRSAAASDALRDALHVAGTMRRPSSKDCF